MRFCVIQAGQRSGQRSYRTRHPSGPTVISHAHLNMVHAMLMFPAAKNSLPCKLFE